jgi:hypothetical protein
MLEMGGIVLAQSMVELIGLGLLMKEGMENGIAINVIPMRAMALV